MAIPAHWGVFAPQIYKTTEGSPQRGSGIPSSSRSSGSSSSKKEEDLGMMFEDGMYYQQGQLAISGQETKIRGEMADFWMDGGTPPAEKQAEWNKSLAAIEQAKMVLRAQEPALKERFNQYKDLKGKANSNTPGNSANRIMVTEQNGLFSSYIGPKRNGGLGMLTQNEMLEYNHKTVGIGPDGAPTGLDFQSPVGYSGAFLTELNTMMQGSSKDIRSSKNIGTIEADGNKWVQLLETADNETQLRNVANTMWYEMAPGAKSDLMSQFHEDMIRGGTISEGKNKDKYFFKMTTEGQGYLLTDEETKVIIAYANSRKLTADQRDDLKRIQEGYAETMIALMVPGKVARTMTIDRIKTSGSGSDGDTAPIKGMFTQIGLGELTTNDGANIMVRKNNVLTETPSTFNPKDGSPDLRSWSNPNATTISNFNEDAKKALIDRGGIRPSSFTGDNNFFYSQRGYTNNIAVLENAQAAVVGLTGRVQENYRPETVNGKDGPELSPVDISKMSDKQLLDVKVKTVEVMIAISEDNFSAFRDQMKELYGVEVDNIDKDEFIKKSYYSYESGKKISTDYYILPIWLPMPDDKLSALDDPNKYAKGTYRAQQELMKKERQQTIARIQNSKVNTSY